MLRYIRDTEIGSFAEAAEGDGANNARMQQFSGNGSSELRDDYLNQRPRFAILFNENAESMRLYPYITAWIAPAMLWASALGTNLVMGSTPGHDHFRSYEVIRQFASGNGTTASHEKCGLPAIAYAMRLRDRLPAEVSSALSDIQARPITQKSILVGGFRVHYDTTGSDAPGMLDSSYQVIPGTADQYADSVAAIANYCEVVETNILGYLPSPTDGSLGGGPEYDIYVASLGDYGYTTPDTTDKPDGATCSSFVTVDNSFQWVSPPANKGMPALRVTLAHELHHSIQIGNYGFWWSEIYFHEITSVWMEDVVFTDVNDYYQYVTSSEGHFSNPDVPFNTSSFIMYSRCIWGHYVAKKFGRDAMRRSWEEARSTPPLQAIDLALSGAPYFSSFRSAFAEWSTWNYFTGSRADTVLYYPEGKHYGEVSPLPAQFSPPSTDITGHLQALGSKYYNVGSGSITAPYVITSLNLSAAYAGDLSSFQYALTLSSTSSGGSSLHTSYGVFISLEVPDISNWYGAVLLGGSQLAGPFPDPFRPDGYHYLSFPIASPASVTGNLSIYTSAMSLLYSGSLTSRYSSLASTQVFEWNGVTNKNILANSGVYIYVIQTQAGVNEGKFAILRK